MTNADGIEHTLKLQREAAIAFGGEPLLTLPGGRNVDLATGYIPLLTQFTFEDKAAKGLRKRKAGDKPETPIYFSALELVRDNKILFLTGASGSGKTTFAKHLSFRLATAGLSAANPVIRNELGDIREESWTSESFYPLYYAVDGPETLRALADGTLPELLGSEVYKDTNCLIILDAVERAGDVAREVLVSLVELVRKHEVKLLLLGETGACERWAPPDVARHALLPLLRAQRKQAASQLLGLESSDVGSGTAAGCPALLALSLQAQHPGDCAEDIVDEWLSVIVPESDEAKELSAEMYQHVAGVRSNEPDHGVVGTRWKPSHAFSCVAVQRLIAARHLATLSSATAVELFRRLPVSSQPIIRSCLVRLSNTGKSDDLIEALLSSPDADSHRGALLVADMAPKSDKLNERIAGLVLDVVTQGILSESEREQAGRILSRLGDPRDLGAVADVPAGTFCMGSENHLNSQPLQSISVGAFRIGIYPVVNRDYQTFVRETGRCWLSADGADPERLNAPATDLTWHDARAYCAWLTGRWRLSGKMAESDEVRLPTEPEWERASRGDQQLRDEAGGDGVVYPWGTEWHDGFANSDEAGFNATCAVGLFPRGRSPYGCYDMAGQVWEWCSTCWGEDMATPAFRYPWRDDGREALDAPGQIRRVLRGGCFSSPKIKANCTYRGSLEPAGFWRGNGFRVVVAPVPSSP